RSPICPKTAKYKDWSYPASCLAVFDWQLPNPFLPIAAGRSCLLSFDLQLFLCPEQCPLRDACLPGLSFEFGAIAYSVGEGRPQKLFSFGKRRTFLFIGRMRKDAPCCQRARTRPIKLSTFELEPDGFTDRREIILRLHDGPLGRIIWVLSGKQDRASRRNEVY